MKPKLLSPKRNTRRMRGFSLLEILVVVAVILIVTGITVPVVNRSVMTYRLTDAATQVTSNIKMARFEAIRTDALVTWQIKEAANTTTMFVDTDRNGTFSPKVKAVIFNSNIHVVPVGTVTTTGGLRGAMGLAGAAKAAKTAAVA